MFWSLLCAISTGKSGNRVEERIGGGLKLVPKGECLYDARIMNIREEALKLLSRWERGGVFAESLIEGAARELRLSLQDRSFLNALVFGVLRNRTWLDYVIDSLRSEGRLQTEVRALLRLGLCQILVMKVPSHAAVNETVSLAPRKAAGLVNALLRRTLREEERIREEWKALPWAVRYSTPEWLVERWIASFGAETAESLLARQQEVPLLYARRHPGIPFVTGVLPEGLEEMAGMPGWYVIKGRLPLEDLKSGALYVADPSTRHAVELLAPRPGEEILDACAAPGGKSAAILEATEGRGCLTATDSAGHRLPRLEENLKKWGASCCRVLLSDWARPCPEEWKGYFDGVLLDVPCSNSGVTRRRVDVRWRLTPVEMARLSALQLSLLENAAAAVKAGGRLIYSTCSIDPEEDFEVVRRFLDSRPGWRLDGERLVLPSEGGMDGAYAARLVCEG